MCKKLQNDDILISKFNLRERDAFSGMYIRLYDEVNNFAKKLFYNKNENYEDIVQDIFVELWDTQFCFKSILHLKNYIYTTIKNKHKDSYKHKLVVDKYNRAQLENIDNFQTSVMIENEVLSILSHLGNRINPEYLQILKLTLDGYKVKEISEILGKSIFTIHHKKKAAIKEIQKFFEKK